MSHELNRYIIKRKLGLRDGVEEISRLSGIPKPTVYSHLNGTRKIGHWTAIRYQKGLGIPLERLFETSRDK